MKGVIFNVVEEIVTDLHGADTWDDLLDAAGLDGAYTALGDYDDAELLAIAAVACEATGVSARDLWRTIGRAALPKLADRLPGARERAVDARAFLLSVNDIIHPEVRMLYEHATPPEFTFSGEGPVVEMGYRSARRLDDLVEGLVLGCGDLYGEAVEIEAIERAGLPPDEARFVVRFGVA